MHRAKANNMANLRIHGDIVNKDEQAFLEFFGGADGSVSFGNVEEFLASVSEDDNRIDITLDCRGGDVHEGWKIYDALRATGKEISALVVGECASMGTAILLAAPKERRSARPHASLLIHNPYIPAAMGELNADELRRMADDMQQEQDRILNLYVERTGADRERLQEVMNEGKWLTTDEAIELGFINTIISPASAKASSGKTIQNAKASMSLLDKIKALIASEEVEVQVEPQPEPVAMELSTATGGTLTIEREEGEPQVGDKASPDGTHKMPDGKTIVVEDGIITEIEVDEEPTDDNEVEELRKENEELRKQLEEANARASEAEANAKSVDDLRIINAVKVAGGIDKVLGAIKSNGQPDGRKVDGVNAANKAEDMDYLHKRLAEVKNKTKK